jgi:hemoglobin/transferrin/lactoferrin receptor protein
MRALTALSTPLCLSIAATVCVPAFAQEKSGPSTRAVVGEPLELTVSGSKLPESFVSSKPVTVVRDKEIRAIGPGSVADALRAHSGVSVQQTTPGQGTIYVRGLAGREVVYLVDGVRVNTAIFRSPNNAPLGLLDPLSIFWLEVIRGSSSVIHGSDALGGVVNINTTLPPFAETPTTLMKAFTSTSSNPLGHMSRVSLCHQESTWSAHAGLSWASFGDVTPGGGLLTPVPHAYVGAEKSADGTYSPAALSRAQLGTGYSRIAADGVFRLQLGAATEAVFRAQYSQRPELIRYDEITPRYSPNGKPARAESFIGPMHRAMTSATVAHRPGGVLDTALLTLAWQQLGDELYRRNYDELSGRLFPAMKATREHTRSDALSARGELRFLSADKRRGAIVGIEAIRDAIKSRARSVDLSNGALSDTSSRYPDGSTMTQGGLFAQLESQIVPTLKGHVGVRGAFFGLDIPARGTAESIRRTLFDAAASVGLHFQPTPILAFTMNGGRGVRSPNIEDYAGAGTRAGGRFQIPNANLTPEHTHSADLGVKVHHGLVRAEAFVFALRFDDAIGVTATTVNGADRSPDGAKYVTSANVARLDFYGVESDVRVGPEKKGGGYARFLLVKYNEKSKPGVSASERVATPPSLVLGAWIHPLPKLRLEAFAHGRGAMKNSARVDDSRIPASGTDAFVTLHARAAYAVTPDVTARLGIDNLTNVRALEYGSGFHLPGISVMAGLEARLAH